MYLTCYLATLDYLPIQASSVPSKHVFSSSAETDTKRRNRLRPLLMEAIQMLKYSIKGCCLDFGTAWVTDESLLGIEEVGGDKSDSMDIMDDVMKVSNDDAWDKISQVLGGYGGEADM